MLKEKIYEIKNWRQIIHTTWNPGGTGVVRIHLIPPKFSLFRFSPAVAVINGDSIVPVDESWAVLLTEFIHGINAFGEKEMSDEQMNEIMSDAFHRVRFVYPNADNEQMYSDLQVMTQTFFELATGKVPETEIGQMTIGDYAPNMKAPFRMDLMVSSMKKDEHWNCNQQCLHCYAANQPYGETQELTTEEWSKIIHKCKKAGISQLTFTGGEPTLRKDLCELIKEARWFITRLNTNGVLLTDNLCDNLSKAEVDNIQITFYSNDANIHNQLVGGNHYEETLAGIRNACRHNLSVSINTPLCKINSDYVETLKFLHDLGIVYVTCSGMIFTGNACQKDSRETNLSEEDLLCVLKKAVEYCYANEMEIAFTSPGLISPDKLTNLGLTSPTCGACLSNMAITPDGRVISCQSALSDVPLGDLRKNQFSKIWNSKKCKKQRLYAAQMKNECPLKKKTDENDV